MVGVEKGPRRVLGKLPRLPFLFELFAEQHSLQKAAFAAHALSRGKHRRDVHSSPFIICRNLMLSTDTSYLCTELISRVMLFRLH